MFEQINKSATQEEITTNTGYEPEGALDNQKDTREMLELALKEANAKLENVFEHQKALVTIIDHEFRTTLTGIQGFSELLCEEELSSEEVKIFARDIHSDAVRLSRVITRFIDLENMQWVFVDFNTIIQTVAEQMQQLTSRHMIHLDPDETLPHIRGDQAKWTQVVNDLVANAVKYSPSGGEVLLKSCSESNVIQLSIQDHGIGIPSHSLETIFDTFRHLYVDKTRYIPGVGLGLPIIKQIVHFHGGHIWVESTLGEGSCFHITLPIPDVACHEQRTT